jgi:glycerophosphoryl diester phosphodiesterase
MSTEVWGHRGWPTRYPDNVLSGISAAGSVATRVEIDVRRTADDELVLSHDPHLKLVPVNTALWDELAALDLGDGHHPATLDQALALEPPVPLNIEIKNSPFDPGFEEDLAISEVVARLARPTDVISSFHWPTVDRIRELRPELSTGLLFEASVPAADAIEHARAMGHDAVVPHWPLIDADLMNRAVDAGLQVVTWTVNETEVARRLAEMSVDAIITNDPGAMAQALGLRTE